jgi:hypothetical protein
MKFTPVMCLAVVLVAAPRLASAQSVTNVGAANPQTVTIDVTEIKQLTVSTAAVSIAVNKFNVDFSPNTPPTYAVQNNDPAHTLKITGRLTSDLDPLKVSLKVALATVGGGTAAAATELGQTLANGAVDLITGIGLLNDVSSNANITYTARVLAANGYTQVVRTVNFTLQQEP